MFARDTTLVPIFSDDNAFLENVEKYEIRLLN